MPDIELLTLLKVVVAPLLPAAALIYGIIRYRQRSPATKQERQESLPLADQLAPDSRTQRTASSEEKMPPRPMLLAPESPAENRSRRSERFSVLILKAAP